MRPMTACTSLSEAALGRPSLLQAAVCYPSLTEAAVVITSLSEAGTSTEHRRASLRRPAPAPTGIAPSTSTRRPVSTTRTATTQHRRPITATHTASTGTGAPCLYHAHCQRPAPAPCLHHARSQLTAPRTSTTARTSARHRTPSTGTLFPPPPRTGKFYFILPVAYGLGAA